MKTRWSVLDSFKTAPMPPNLKLERKHECLAKTNYLRAGGAAARGVFRVEMKLVQLAGRTLCRPTAPEPERRAWPLSLRLEVAAALHVAGCSALFQVGFILMHRIALRA